MLNLHKWVRAPPARRRARTPAHPGLDALAPPGLPGAQRGLIVFIQPAQAGFVSPSRGLQPDGVRQPAQAGFVLASRGLPPDGVRQPAQAGFALPSRGLPPDGVRQPAQAGFASRPPHAGGRGG
jgi:hypothetical protein